MVDHMIKRAEQGLEYFDPRLSNRANRSAIVELEGDFACLGFGFYFYTGDLPDLICWVSKGPPCVFLLGSRRYLEEGVLDDPPWATDASTLTPDVVDFVAQLIGRSRWLRADSKHYESISEGGADGAAIAARYAIKRAHGEFLPRTIRARVQQLNGPEPSLPWQPKKAPVLVGSPCSVIRQAGGASESDKR